MAHSPQMNPTSRIAPLLDLPAGIEALRTEAAAECFGFVEKLIGEWCCGTNRFAQPGEVFLGAFRAGELVAVGGLNRDPYADQDGIGRLRHVYVRQSDRRCGVGAAVVRQLLTRADGVFHLVRLRTATPEAGEFYVSMGFRPVQDEAASHVMSLRRSEKP
jgi:GNAT superfamily N-acetyltransferase